MEHMGAMLEGEEWNHLSAMYTTHEEADFMAQLLNNCSAQVPNEQSLMYDHNNDAYSFSQGSNSYSNGSGILVPNSCQENYYLNESHQFLAMNNSSMSINFSGGEDKRVNSPPEVYTNPMMEMGGCLNREMSSGSLELSGGDLAEPAYEKKLQIRKSPDIPAPETQKKRSRVSGDVQKKRNVKTKKNQKLAVDDEEEDNNGGGVHGQNLTSCCSEEEDESNGGGASSGLTPFAAVLNSSGKTRASRGSATDPQSLYARKRRERINERLKVLQNLVPNGTKVDISTMLEEAVQYVKFLQLQIKLLSSDDMWMYAPLAYNGMDLGLDLKIGMHMPRSTS